MPRAGRYLIHIEHPTEATAAAVGAAAGAGAVGAGAAPMEALVGSPFALTVLPSVDDPSCLVIDLQSGLVAAVEGAPAVLVAGQVLLIVTDCV